MDGSLKLVHLRRARVSSTNVCVCGRLVIHRVVQICGVGGLRVVDNMSHITDWGILSAWIPRVDGG